MTSKRFNGKKVQQLFTKIRQDLKIEISSQAYIERCYHGHWQMSAGGFSFEITDPGTFFGANGLGSSWPITTLLKGNKLEQYSGYIDPGNEAGCKKK